MSEQQAKDTIGGGVLAREKMAEVINRVLTKVGEAEMIARESLYKEIKELHEIIEEARNEMASARPGDIKATHIPSATDELDAVVAATEEATSAIMDACDVIERKCEEIGNDKSQEIVEEVMKIYEACSFQDITGQRITKVIHSLVQIDKKVETILKVIGGSVSQATSTEEDDTRVGDEKLLNGPQLPEKGVTQDDIDKLLAEFD